MKHTWAIYVHMIIEAYAEADSISKKPFWLSEFSKSLHYLEHYEVWIVQ